MNIHILDEEIIKRIAAGEVVERPASVVKELVENALDARAKKISLELRGAGRLLIRLGDDGMGMEKEDLLISVQRHTTSKIQRVEDMDAITSLGFRGEALYSIAAVSRMEITTRTKDSVVAHRLRVEGGKVLDCLEVGAPVGTTVEIRDLFWNTPARLKFLKSPQTELNHVFEVMAHHALARSDVGFQLRECERSLMDVAPNQDLLSRIKNIYQGLGEEWMGLDFKGETLQVKGYVSHPKMARGDRSYQFFFVNGRPVKSPALSYALEASFHSLLPEAKRPLAFLLIQIDPREVDVNVHPAKREVRFKSPSIVQDQLREAVRRALSISYAPSSPSTPSVWPDRVREAVGTYFQSQSHSSEMKESPAPRLWVKSMDRHGSGKSEGALSQEAALENFPQRVRSFRVLGCFDDLYWVIEWEDGLSLMDQHAAHERVLYEKYLKDWRSRKLEVQPLLLPTNFELAREDHGLLLEHQGLLKNLGFGLEEFGDGALLINQVPSYCQTQQLKELILDILDDLKTLRKTFSFNESQLEEKIMLRACKSAVKAHDTMTSEEIERLVDDLLTLELPYTCPHGRPTLIKFTANDLAKMFKRK
ncbi:MAG: DNA mismatch repair endonuclease MutL [Chlamydiae bacterium]|nr:DNA mismatch repair endonuclease MutL [Chlamydiota bacterium]MBI3266540.1 DNA mismatch repair endonuclease MutL [Chlamydiota bacterium]